MDAPVNLGDFADGTVLELFEGHDYDELEVLFEKDAADNLEGLCICSYTIGFITGIIKDKAYW